MRDAVLLLIAALQPANHLSQVVMLSA